MMALMMENMLIALDVDGSSVAYRYEGRELDVLVLCFDDVSLGGKCVACVGCRWY
jgi:hypothetical protein